MRWLTCLGMRSMHRCAAGGTSPGCSACGRSAWMGAKCCSVSPRPRGRARRAAEQRRQAMVSRYPRDFPEACRGRLDEAEASLTHLYVPQRQQQYVRTSNLAARAFEEERRRTQVIPHLWDEGSVVKLGFAVL